MKKIFVSLILFLSQSLYSQEDLNNLFIKCDRCDNNFLKNEINYVNHVREQGLADIQLFIYRNRNANNGIMITRKVFLINFVTVAIFNVSGLSNCWSYINPAAAT